MKLKKDLQKPTFIANFKKINILKLSKSHNFFIVWAYIMPLNLFYVTTAFK